MAEEDLIVVIDDDDFVVDAIRTILELWGFRVATARCADDDCPDFVRLADPGADRPVLIVSDYRLPRSVTGLDAIDRLRATFGAEIPAVLLTGNSGDQLPGLDERGIVHLLKPVEAADLKQVIADLVPDA